MESILFGFVVLLGIIVTTSIINEKILHIPKEIALIIVSFAISLIMMILKKLEIFDFEENILRLLNKFNLNEFLLEATLCFMLFAGASKIHLNKFVNNLLQITSLAVISTIVSAAFYTVIFYGISLMLGLNMNIWVCLLLGALISPTDPIAATGILNKLRNI